MYAYSYLYIKYRVDTVFNLMSPLLYLLYIEGIFIKKEEIGYDLWPRRLHVAVTNDILI